MRECVTHHICDCKQAELDALRERVNQLERDNQKLKGRLVRLREVIKYAVGPTRDYKPPMLKQALLQDDETEKQ